MSPRQITPNAEPLPPLTLPPGALAESDANYAYDVETDPPKVEPVEHRIRVDFMAGGPISREALLRDYNPWQHDPGDPDPWRDLSSPKPTGVEYAEATCERTRQEEQRFYEHYDDDAVLASAPEYLAHQLRQCRDAADPARCVADERENRRAWYRKLIPWKNLYGICKRSSLGSLLPGQASQESFRDVNDFVGVVVVADDTEPDAYAQEHDLPPRFVYRESAVTSRDSSDVLGPSDLGIELPAPLLVGQFHSDSRYVFLPWSDGLICSCPYKHEYPWRVACKHELLAALVAGVEDSIFLPLDSGVDVPTRARRFVSPTVYCQHEPSPHTGR